MKILIKPQLDYPVGSNYLKGKHDYIDQIWDIQLFKTFQELGHEVKFIQKNKIEPYSTSDFDNYDLLLFYEITSFYQDQEYSIHLLKNFKGIKTLYIPTYTATYPEITEQFHYIFNADSPLNIPKWRKFHPHVNIAHIGWHSPRVEFLDNDIENPYTDKEFKLVYFGIVNELYLETLMQLAEDGEQIYFGGVFRAKDHTWPRQIPQELIKKFSPNLHMVTNGDFECGTQFKWIRHANLGLVFYPVNYPAAVNHKIVEYLTCGTRCLIEEPSPNAYRALRLNAGRTFKFRNYDQLYKLIQEEKKIKYNKDNLRLVARDSFDMKKVCAQIIQRIKK